MSFYTADDVVIDPAMKDLATYMKYYDYDLLGTPIGTTRDFIRDPVGFLKQQITMYKPELIFSSIILLATYFIFFLVKFCFGSATKFCKSAWMFNKEWKRAMAEMKARNARGLPLDRDIAAQAIYRTLTTHYGIKSSTKEAPVPDNAVEYEAARFALQTAWLTGPSLETLLEADPFRSLEDEPIEGAAEDEEMEKLLDEIEWEDEVEEEVEDISSEDHETADKDVREEETEFMVEPSVDEEQYSQDGELMTNVMLTETESAELEDSEYIIGERDEYTSEEEEMMNGQDVGYHGQEVEDNVKSAELGSWFESDEITPMERQEDRIGRTTAKHVLDETSVERDREQVGLRKNKTKKALPPSRPVWRY